VNVEGQLTRNRLPRFQRHRFRKPALVLQERDRAIIRVVADYRVISSEEIQALMSGSGQSILRRLQKLYHGGFLDRPKHQTLQPNRKIVYALGHRGAHLLAGATGDAGLERRDWSERNRQLKIGFLEHALMISRFRTVLELARRDRDDVRIESWRQGDEVRDHVTVDNGDRVERIPVCPDAFFTLHLTSEPDGRNRVHVFLEADRSTMTLKRFLTKMRGYWHYWQSGRQTDRFGVRNFLVLSVAPSIQRASNLCQITRQVDASNHPALRMFLFGPERNYTLAEPSRILESVWNTPADSDQHSLLE